MGLCPPPSNQPFFFVGWEERGEQSNMTIWRVSGTKTESEKEFILKGTEVLTVCFFFFKYKLFMEIEWHIISVP